MKMIAGKMSVIAVCVGLTTPLALVAQNSAARFGGANRGVERFTLLTGPNLLSPATRPLASPTIISERVSSGNSLSHAAAFSFDSQEKAAEAELQGAQERLAEAQRRLERLRAERAAALQRKRELEEALNARDGRVPLPQTEPAAAPADPIRFDARMPAFSPELPKNPPPANSSLKPE